MHLRRLAFILLGLAAGLMLSGCSRKAAVPSDDQSLRQTELQQIWEVYTSYIRQNKRPPRQYADVKGYGTVFSEGLRALKDGQCVAIWGVADAATAAANKILAYEKAAPQQGGLVVFGDGTVKHLTAAEFQAAPKAAG
jgi:hypothetical protein